MAKSSGIGSGIKSVMITVIMIVLLGGFVSAVLDLNRIEDVESGYHASKTYSEKLDACVQEWVSGNYTACTKFGKGGSSSSGNSGGGADSKDGEKYKVDTEKLKSSLDAITIANPVEEGYNRSDWKHWSDLDGNKCDTRQDTLIKDGTDIVMRQGTTCRVESGKWIGPYNGETFTNPSDLDIDHIIPLEYASFHGGAKWDAKKKEQFANDPQNLLATSAKENRSKGSKGPADYMPPREEFQCSYASSWINLSSKYNLSITDKDKRELSRALRTC